VVGPIGGIQVESIEAHDSARQALIDAVGTEVPRTSESDRLWVDAARLLATSWEMTITIENRQARVTLPEPAREILRLPGAGASVVVFGFGEILEIWSAVDWEEHVRGLAKAKSSLIAESIRQLQDR
jgi:DNA-binding transcriptional regulator/RsmH inhibitor MraZ